MGAVPHRTSSAWIRAAAAARSRLMNYFGLGQSSVAERGYQIMHAAGIQPASAYPAVRLGSPGLLVSARRRRIIELRDLHRGAISEQRRA